MPKNPSYPPKNKKKPNPPPPPPRKVEPGAMLILPSNLKCIIFCRIWVCMQILERGPGYARWQFQGVYSTEEAAISACRDHTYGIGPAVMDEEHPHKKYGNDLLGSP